MTRQTLAAEDVYKAIFSHVISQKLGPGDRLNLDALARQFNVFQTPIRQALERLRADRWWSASPIAGFARRIYT